METIQEYICAFSNTNGGTMYIGIADSGMVAGTFCDRTLMDKIGLSIDQIVINTITIENENETNVKPTITNSCTIQEGGSIDREKIQNNAKYLCY